jgi:3',5'-cyclic AMP phosphodiesterase CpdA
MMTTTRSRLFLPLLILTVAGMAAFAQAVKQKPLKLKKATGPMPVLAPVPKTGTLSSPTSNTDFTFIVLGDNRPQKPVPQQPAITSQLIDDMKQYHPSFILWTGDVIAGKDATNASLIKSEYKAFFDLAKTAGVPVFNAPGNHEMNAAGNAPCPTMDQLYKQNMKSNDLYGAFAYGNSRFIALNTDSLTKSANSKCKPPSKNFDNKGYVNNQQLKSLDAYLQANASAQYIFIFMHRPMLPKSGGVGLNAVSTQKLQQIFAKYTNIAYVFAAHEHLYYNALAKDNSPPPCVGQPWCPSTGCPPFYLVSGGAGAPLHPDKDDAEEEEGEFDPDAFYNYLVFKVSATGIQATLVNCGTDADPKTNPCRAQPSCATH